MATDPDVPSSPADVLAIPKSSAANHIAAAPGGPISRANTTSSPGSTVHPAEQLIHEAIAGLQRQRAISAKIRHRVDIMDKRLVGSGSYLEQNRPDGRPLLHLELTMQTSNETSSLTQICDGKTLFTHLRVPGIETLTQLNVEKAIAAMAEAEEAGGASTLPGLGGLARVLRGLDRNFTFDQAQRGTWGSDQVPIWRIHGTWTSEMLQKLLPDQADAIAQGEPADTSKLRANVPDHVYVYLGRDDRFPYRIEYHRAGEDGETKPLVIMQLYDVVFGRPVPVSQFSYNPSEKDHLQPKDVTAAFEESLR